MTLQLGAGMRPTCLEEFPEVVELPVDVSTDLVRRRRRRGERESLTLAVGGY